MRWLVMGLVLVLAIGLFVLSRFLESSAPPAPPVEEPAPQAAVVPEPVETPAPEPAVPAAPPMTVERLDGEAATGQKAVDARQANHWHYVTRLGDGPGVIYSRTGTGWDYAFACTPKTKTIEFIAIGTGSPGSFEKQSLTVGPTKMTMDAYYSESGGGTIGAKLPASDTFFSTLDGSSPLEIQLYESRKTIVSVGPEVMRLVQACRGQG